MSDFLPENSSHLYSSFVLPYLLSKLGHTWTTREHKRVIYQWGKLFIRTGEMVLPCGIPITVFPWAFPQK